ncbi:MAG: hypothetical protein ACOYMQ_06665 [Pseudanabaena sp.]|jgi:hypothetical protein
MPCKPHFTVGAIHELPLPLVLLRNSLLLGLCCAAGTIAVKPKKLIAPLLTFWA